MDAEPLVDCYARYKRGTSKLLIWLCDSASACGINVPPKPKSAAKNTRVPCAHLVVYATAIISATDPKIDIPFEILDVVNDVIKGRKLCAEFYQTFAAKEEDSNGRHKHFISVLEEVYEILRREYKQRLPKRKKKIPTLTSDTNDINNLFCHLGLEDPVSDSEDDVSSTEQVSQPQTNATEQREVKLTPNCGGYELDDEEEEKRFAIWCLLRDFQEVRGYIRDVWQQYVDGTLSMMAASKITEYGISIINNLDADFIDRHPDLKQFSAIIDLLGIEQCMMERMRSPVGLSPQPQGEDLPRPEEGRLSGLLCLDAFCTLNDLVRLTWFYGWRDTGLYKDQAPVLHCTPRPYAVELLALSKDIAEMLTMHFYVKDSRQRKGPPQLQNVPSLLDPLTKVLVQTVAEARPVDATSVYVLQILSDIYDKLDGQMDRGIKEATEIIDRVREMCVQGEEYYEREPSTAKEHYGGRPPTDLRGIHNMVEVDKFNNGTDGWRVRSCICEKSSQSLLPFNVLKKLPLLPMYAARFMVSKIQSCGSAHGGVNSLVLSVAHLRNAAKLSGGLTDDWPDLDMLVEAQNALKPFARPGNGTILGVAKQYSLAMGIPLHQVARARSEPKLANAKKLEDIVPRVERIDLVSTSCDNLYAHRDKFSDTAIYYESIRRLAARGELRNPVIAAQWKNTRKLETAQLLEVLLDVVVSEEKHLNFAYWTFADFCATWIHKFMEVYFNSPRCKEWSGSWALVHRILWEAGLMQQRGIAKGSAVLHSTGVELDGMLEHEGVKDQFLRASLEVSSGHLPTHLQPAIKYADIPKATPPDLKSYGIITTNRQSKGRSLSQWQYDRWSSEKSFRAFLSKGEANAAIYVSERPQLGDFAASVQRMTERLKSGFLTPSLIVLGGQITFEKLEHHASEEHVAVREDGDAT